MGRAVVEPWEGDACAVKIRSASPRAGKASEQRALQEPLLPVILESWDLQGGEWEQPLPAAGGPLDLPQPCPGYAEPTCPPTFILLIFLTASVPSLRMPWQQGWQGWLLEEKLQL